ncbi:MAG: hypothetical protein CL559_04265 [Alphaproteobacteria bacterium]|nr:hypothetical protein [Alphaproteobacteria bacterium]
MRQVFPSGHRLHQPSPMDRMMGFFRRGDARTHVFQLGLSGMILVGSTTPTALKSTIRDRELPIHKPDPETGGNASPPDDRIRIAHELTAGGKPLTFAPAVKTETVPVEAVLNEPETIKPVVPEVIEPVEVVEVIDAVETGAPSATAGPFRDGMKTSFSNAPVITEEMAEAMNIAYDRLRSYPITKNAAIAWTLHGLHESQGGTILREKGKGDGVGFFQFSIWNGNGAGSEISELPKRGTDRNWERGDFMTVDEGGTAPDRASAIISSVDALVQSLHAQQHYQSLYRASGRHQTTISRLAKLSTGSFIRPGVSWSGRSNGITKTYDQNKKAIEANIASFEAERQRDALLPGAIPVPIPVRRPDNLAEASVEALVSTGKHPAERGPAMPR